MDWFTVIKNFYDDNLWTVEQVGIATTMKKITAEEYKLITGDKYVV